MEEDSYRLGLRNCMICTCGLVVMVVMVLVCWDCMQENMTLSITARAE